MSKALVVDDDHAIRRMLEFSLTMDGFEVVTAGDGREALELIRTSRPDVVLLDVMMPQIDGFEVLSRTRSDPELKDIPIILLTALTRDEDIWAGWRSGICSYISKPMDPSILRKEIERVTEPRSVAMTSSLL